MEGSVVVGQVRAAKANHGLNVDTEQMVDMVAEGIIDPAMVTRSALQNAASIAKNIITTETLVVNKPEEGAGGGGPMGPNMGGGMPPGMM
jgi:chaperonin GroEL